MQKERATVTVNESGKKIDKFVRQHIKDISFNAVSAMLRKGQIKVNGKKQKNSYVVEAGDVVEIYGQFENHEKKSLTNQHKSIAKNIQVLYMDDDVLIINKPSGLAVQGGTKVGVSVDDLSDLLKFGSENKPKLVHRIDRDTSGVLIMARNDSAARSLSKMFKNSGSIKKHYIAICSGYPSKSKGTISIPLKKIKLDGSKEVMSYSAEDGDEAITLYKVLKHNQRASLIQFDIITGRTHQVRAHAAITGMPIVGDEKYGFDYCISVRKLLTPNERQAFTLQNTPPRINNEKQLFLHAESVEFELHGKKISAKAPIPQRFDEALERLSLT
jgi:23S rRNA pseudouridine955/2504/2580 synthase